MITLTEGAFAKLNLTLDVLAKREDGYHDISSIMQTVSVRDDIRIDLDTHAPWSIDCDDPDVPCNASNLAWRAAETYFSALGTAPDGVSIHITKRIPMQAGMAGGSADAAAVLRALNRWSGEPFSVLALSELGAQIGSDVPFCVLCGTALCEGRGERLTPLRETPEMFFVICKPEIFFATPTLFQKLDEITIARRPDQTKMRAALQRGDLAAIGKELCNVFEQAVTLPEMNYIKSILMTYGAYGTQMTGSGSAIFGIFDSFEYAAVACTMLKENYPNVFIAKSV